MSTRDEQRFLLEAAAWQDQLLLSYRALQTRVQLALLLAGTVVCGAAWLAGGAMRPAALAVQLCLFAAHAWAARVLQRLVLARAADVDWWHRRLIAAEQGLPEAARRHFTAFKLHQRQRRGDAGALADLFLSPSAQPLTEHDLDQLIEKGIGHTRRVADHHLLAVIRALWIALLLAAAWPWWRALLGFAPN